MGRNGWNVWLAIVLMGGLVLLAACSLNPKPAAFEAAEITKTATVVDVDADNRAITLQTPDGDTQSYQLSSGVKNFDQIRKGDQVRSTTLESVAIFIRKANEQPDMAQSRTVQLAPKGAKPGMVITDTIEVTAVVADLDLPTRRLSIREPNGKIRTLTVDKQAKNLDKLKVGDQIVTVITKAVMLGVEKPGPNTGADQQ